MNEPIEEYLDELLGRLRLPPRATRRLLAETEDHLRESAAAAQAAGVSRVRAERQAVASFGSPSQVAMAAAMGRRLSPVETLTAVGWAAMLLGGIGLVAVGLSGLLAAIFNIVAGRRFVGDLHQTYSLAACRHFLAVRPGVPNCSAAAILENSADAVALRVAAGIVGLLLVGLAIFGRRYLRTDPSFRRILTAAVSVAALIAFVVAAAALAGASVDNEVHYGTQGLGWYLSGALISLLAATLAAAQSWRVLRVIRPWAGTMTS